MSNCPRCQIVPSPFFDWFTKVISVGVQTKLAPRSLIDTNMFEDCSIIYLFITHSPRLRQNLLLDTKLVLCMFIWFFWQSKEKGWRLFYLILRDVFRTGRRRRISWWWVAAFFLVTNITLWYWARNLDCVYQCSKIIKTIEPTFILQQFLRSTNYWFG